MTRITLVGTDASERVDAAFAYDAEGNVVTTWRGTVSPSELLFLASLVAAPFMYQYSRELRSKLEPSEQAPAARWVRTTRERHRVPATYLRAFLAAGVCARVLPAAAFDALLVRPSRRTFDAAVAAGFEVTFFGALVCDSALPAAAFDAFPVAGLASVFEAALAADLPVVFDFAILSPPGFGR